CYRPQTAKIRGAHGLSDNSPHGHGSSPTGRVNSILPPWSWLLQPPNICPLGTVRMLSIDDAYVDAAAPNADAAKNGRGLVLKNKLANLHVSDDGTLLFGECQGSGKQPYQCSCDFARPEQPTHRCTCPSRQLPCKHCLGPMY